MTKELIKPGETLPKSIDEIQRYAKMYHASGLFNDVKDFAQAAVKVSAGAELGIGPFASMAGIYIIQGKITLSANLMGACLRRHNYDYKVLELTPEICTIEFYNALREKLGETSFTIDDAKAAGVYKQGGPWTKYPRNMLFARAMSNGCRFFAPECFSGAAPYVPEELGAIVNEDGEVIEIPGEK